MAAIFIKESIPLFLKFLGSGLHLFFFTIWQLLLLIISEPFLLVLVILSVAGIIVAKYRKRI